MNLQTLEKYFEIDYLLFKEVPKEIRDKTFNSQWIFSNKEDSIELNGDYLNLIVDHDS